MMAANISGGGTRFLFL